MSINASTLESKLANTVFSPDFISSAGLTATADFKSGANKDFYAKLNDANADPKGMVQLLFDKSTSIDKSYFKNMADLLYSVKYTLPSPGKDLEKLTFVSWDTTLLSTAKSKNSDIDIKTMPFSALVADLYGKDPPNKNLNIPLYNYYLGKLNNGKPDNAVIELSVENIDASFTVPTPIETSLTSMRDTNHSFVSGFTPNYEFIDFGYLVGHDGSPSAAATALLAKNPTFVHGATGITLDKSSFTPATTDPPSQAYDDAVAYATDEKNKLVTPPSPDDTAYDTKIKAITKIIDDLKALSPSEKKKYTSSQQSASNTAVDASIAEVQKVLDLAAKRVKMKTDLSAELKRIADALVKLQAISPETGESKAAIPLVNAEIVKIKNEIKKLDTETNETNVDAVNTAVVAAVAKATTEAAKAGVATKKPKKPDDDTSGQGRLSVIYREDIYNFLKNLPGRGIDDTVGIVSKARAIAKRYGITDTSSLNTLNRLLNNSISKTGSSILGRVQLSQKFEDISAVVKDLGNLESMKQRISDDPNILVKDTESILDLLVRMNVFKSDAANAAKEELKKVANDGEKVAEKFNQALQAAVLVYKDKKERTPSTGDLANLAKLTDEQKEEANNYLEELRKQVNLNNSAEQYIQVLALSA